MSNDLINALESRVSTVVQTIEGLRTANEGLRTENTTLREERQILESKLRELLDKIELAENGDSAPSADESGVSSFSSAPSEAAGQESGPSSFSEAPSDAAGHESGSTQQSGDMDIGSGQPGSRYGSQDY